MRPIFRCAALLPLFLLALALPAHADPIDDFSITGGGATIDFSLPVTTTQPCLSCLGGGGPDQFNFGSVTGTVNGASQSIHLDFILGGGCSVCETIQLTYGSTGWTIFLPSSPSLYDITYSGTYPNENETFTFVPGTYTTAGYGNTQPSNVVPFETRITPEAAATPEPGTIFSLITAALALPLLKRRRVVTS